MAITEKLSRVPMGTILDTPSGKFKTIIVDTVEKLELPLAHMVPELTANILIPVLMLVYLFSLDWRLALISLVTIPVGAFCYMGMMKDYEKRYARVLAAGKNMDAATVEYIGGIEVVKTFNQGERLYKKYADAVVEDETAKVTWFKQTNGYYVMGLSILTSTLVGVLPLGSWLFINGRVEAGKSRVFTVPLVIQQYIENYCLRNHIGRADVIFPITERAIQKQLAIVCDYLGYEGISTHSFRKWYATEIYKSNGYDIALVQRLLQHSSAATTQRYIGIEPQRIEQAIEGHARLM